MASRELKMDVGLARRVLKEVKEVLDAHDVEFWLNFGALLGAIREGKFIEHDDDIEINAWSHKIDEEKMREVCKDLCQRGFSAYYSTLTDYITIWKDNFNVSFSMYTLRGDKAERPHEHIWETVVSKHLYLLSEIFAIRRVGRVNNEVVRDLKSIFKYLSVSFTGILPEFIRRRIAIFLRSLSRLTGGEYGKTRIPARFYQNLGDLKFYDMIFKAPSETEEYLECIYGSDWKIPLKNWKFYHDENRANVGIEIVDKLWDYKSRLN